MVEFCRERGIAHEICGKVVVAVRTTSAADSPSSTGAAVANGVDVELIGPRAAARARAARRRRGGAARAGRPASPTSPACARHSPTTSSPRGGELRLEHRGRRRRRPDRPRWSCTTTAGDIETERRRQLRRAARRPRRAPARRRRARRRAWRSSRSAASTSSSRPSRSHLVRDADLPGARPAVPVPRRPPHPQHRTAASTPARTPCSRSPARATRGGRSTRTTSPRRVRFAGFRELAAAQWRYGLSEMARSVEPRPLRRCARPPRAGGPRARTSSRRRPACAPRPSTATARLARRLRVLAQQRRPRHCTSSTRRHRPPPRRSRSPITSPTSSCRLRGRADRLGDRNLVGLGAVLAELDLANDLQLDELDADDALQHRVDVLGRRVGHCPRIVVRRFEPVGQVADQTMRPLRVVVHDQAGPRPAR